MTTPQNSRAETIGARPADEHIWAWRIDRLYTLRPRLCRWLNGDAGLIVGYGSGLTYSAWMVPNTDEA